MSAYYAAVIDGATPKTSFRYPNGETPGARAARLLSAALKDLPQNADAYTAFNRLNATLTQSGVEAANRPTASMVIFSRCRREVWMVGDCQYALLTISPKGVTTLQTYDNPKRIDNVLSQWRSNILHSLLSRGICSFEEAVHNDLGRKIIQPFITRQVRYQNLPAEHPLAYGVLDGEPIPHRFIRCHAIGPEVRQIILATDGYPKLCTTLQETEDELNRLLQLDPLCIDSLAGTKGIKPGNISYDDRTYLRLEL